MKDINELQKEFLDNVKKKIEENSALSHVGVYIYYNDDFYIEESLKEDGVFDELKDKWVEEFYKITDLYEDYVIKVISQFLGRPIVSYHTDDEFVLEFLEIQNEDEEKKLWDVITSLGCNIEYISSDDTNYKFIIRELLDDKVEDKHNLFSIFVKGIEFMLPLTNQYIYNNI